MTKLESNLRGLHSNKTLISMAVAAIFINFPLVANAQEVEKKDDEPAKSQLETIEVTAQRRVQSIDSVGVSITAFSGDMMSKQGITDTRGLAAQTPGLIFDGGSGQGVNAWVTIRGVTQVDYSEHQEAPNAVYLDDAYVATPSMVGFPTYDMERAEVLRGPQGTLFGRNTTGGLLHFITNDPTDSFEGFIDARYGNFNRSWLEGAIGGPLTDNINYRIAGFIQNGDGYYENQNDSGIAGDNQDAFEQEAYGLRGKVAIDLGGDWSAKLSASINRSPKHVEGAYKTLPGYVNEEGLGVVLDENENLAVVAPDLVASYGYGDPGVGNDLLGYRDPYSDPHVGSFNSNNSWLEKNIDYGTLKIEGPVGDMTLTSVTNYTSADIDYSEDADSTPNEFFNYRSRGETTQFSQELRLTGDTDKLHWTTGLFYISIDGEYGTDFDFVAFDILYLNTYEQDVEAYSVFGQIEYDLTDDLTLTLGGRLNRDEKEFISVVNQNEAGEFVESYNFSVATVGDAALVEDNDWTGKVALDYQATKDVLVFGSVSRGIRAGGFNATSDGYLPIANTPIQSESVIAYETGVKATMADNTLKVRASTFLYDYTDYQTFNFNGLSTSVQNHDAEIYGAEIELFWLPADTWNISLGGSLLEAKVEGIPVGDSVATVEPVKAPGETFNGMISKYFEFGSYEFTVQYDFDYMGPHKSNLTPSEITNIDSSFVQNLRFSLGQYDSEWEVYAYVHNLADVDRKTYGYDNTFASLALSSYAPPRMYGLGFRKSFY